MPSQSSTQHKDYILITDVYARQQAGKEMDLNTQNWKHAYNIDDSDLTFDGKPLNMLYEENKWRAEHVMESPVKYSTSSQETHGEKQAVSEVKRAERWKVQNKPGWLPQLALDRLIEIPYVMSNDTT